MNVALQAQKSGQKDYVSSNSQTLVASLNQQAKMFEIITSSVCWARSGRLEQSFPLQYVLFSLCDWNGKYSSVYFSKYRSICFLQGETYVNTDQCLWNVAHVCFHLISILIVWNFKMRQHIRIFIKIYHYYIVYIYYYITLGINPVYWKTFIP